MRPLLLVLAVLAVGATPAAAATSSLDTSLKVSYGTVLHGTLTGRAPIAPRPTVVEFSPYGRASGTFDPGPRFNTLVVEDRGTGRSGGAAATSTTSRSSWSRASTTSSPVGPSRRSRP